MEMSILIRYCEKIFQGSIGVERTKRKSNQGQNHLYSIATLKTYDEISQKVTRGHIQNRSRYDALHMKAFKGFYR